MPMTVTYEPILATMPLSYAAGLLKT
jgi:hypothetical protein